MLLNRIHQRAEQIAGAADPAGQRRAGDIHALAGVNLRLPVQWQVIAELGNDDVGQKCWSGKTAFNRPRWRRRFDDAVAALAAELRPHMTNDLEAVGNILQLLRDVFAKLPQLATAIRTAIAPWNVRDNF